MPPKQKQHLCSCSVETSTATVDAGAELELVVTVSCPHGCDLTGTPVSIRDADGHELVVAELTAAHSDDDDEAGEDEVAATATLRVKAPAIVGEHAYIAELVSPPRSKVVHRSEPMSVAVATRAHVPRLTVWDVPSAISAGESFSFKAGVKCSMGCSHAGRPLQLLDAGNNEVAALEVGPDTWRGTAGLFYAEISATAPKEPGTYQWQLYAPQWDAGMPHAEGTTSLTLQVVPAPEFSVTIEAVDREKQTPISGANVVMHPYRAVTDESGIARLRVARGSYRVMISGSKYVPVRTDVTLTGDWTSRAELDRAPPPPNPDDFY